MINAFRQFHMMPYLPFKNDELVSNLVASVGR